MRYIRSILLAGAALCANPAFAADALKFGLPPSWVRSQPIPSAKPTQAPIALLLNDQQTMFDRGKIVTFSEEAVQIQNEQGLAAGNLALVWQPATDTVTINKLQIRRGDKVIDVLAGGQTFTILRRETNLDAATLDGTLTGTLQPEGLQVGDIIDFATTVERSDPVLKGHVENMFAAWDGVPIQAAHASLRWPADLHVQVRQTPNLPLAQRSSSNGMNLLEISAKDVQPLIAPKGAPQRFRIGRLAEATDFAAWSDLANLFSPLYREASAIPASGPLHDEVERIRTASTNPKTRAEQALALVQDRIRYVALVMGQGGYVPAPAETTWSRRFGDCKAKTALLLGILHSLGIQAEPVVVQARLGDMIADRSPMVALFNHVLVRAHVGGKDYWLDGTRTGDTDLDLIETPDFGWGLPLVDHAQLVRMVPKPLDSPNLERHVAIDATAGIFAPATITIDELYRGDSAVGLNASLSALTAEQRDQQVHDEAKSFFDGFTTNSSSVQFDKAKRELHLSIKGSAKLNWKDGWFNVPTSSIAFDPDFDRSAGPLHDAPIAVDHPRFVKDEAAIHLPPGFASSQELKAPVHETLAGVEYVRSESAAGDVVTVQSSERSVAPEISYKEATAAAPRLKALDSDDIYLRVEDSYHPTDADLAALQQLAPASADDYVRRADAFLSHDQPEKALDDLKAALQLDPKDITALGKRVNIYTKQRNYAAAEKDLATIEGLDPTLPSVPGARAQIDEGKGDYQACVADYSKFLEREPHHSYATLHRAMCEAALGRYDAALAEAAAMLKENPNWINFYELRSKIFMAQGKPDLVATEIEAMTRANPKSDYAWTVAGEAYAKLGQLDKSRSAYDHSLAIKLSVTTYLSRYSIRRRSDVKGRIADLDAALKLQPDNSLALREKADLLAESGDSAGALAILDGIKSAPNQDVPLFIELERALILHKAGRTAEADKLLAELDSRPKSPLTLNNMCFELATAGYKLETALRYCREAIKLAPQEAAFLDSLGMVLLKLGKLGEALAAYNDAVAKGEGAVSLMGRAFVYLMMGDHQRAEADAAAARLRNAGVDDAYAGFGLQFDAGAGAGAKKGAAAATKS